MSVDEYMACRGRLDIVRVLVHVKGFHNIDTHVLVDVGGEPFDIWVKQDGYTSLCPSCSNNPKGEGDGDETDDELELLSLIADDLQVDQSRVIGGREGSRARSGVPIMMKVSDYSSHAAKFVEEVHKEVVSSNPQPRRSWVVPRFSQRELRRSASVITTLRVVDHSDDAMAWRVWSMVSAWGLKAKGVDEKWIRWIEEKEAREREAMVSRERLIIPP